MADATGYRIAVGGVGAVLGLFVVAGGVILATGHDLDQAFWTTATGLAGALVGILAPPPSSTKGGAAGRAALQAHVVAAAAARRTAINQLAKVEQATADNDEAAAGLARQRVDAAAASATSHADAAAALHKVPWSIAIPILLAVAVGCEVVLFARPSHLTADLAKQMEAFAAAALGAAIGLLAPSPSSASSTN